MMDQNKAAISALREYIKIKNPKYAFMIEAPWGSGKTHLVKLEFKDALSKGEARYVTLNGVKDRKEFRRALLADISDKNFTASVGKFGDALGKIAKIGNVGTIIQDVVEDRMINDLPSLLIFDDVERCEMSPPEILGILNEFVEHKSKNVILCSFIEQSDDSVRQKDRRELFLTLKEKVVGRTVRLLADVGKALPDFIYAMPEGHGKIWFQANQAIVLDVFASGKHSNLRVLRQCIHDCGRVIEVLDDNLRTSADAMCRFVCTYLALAMMLATGKISSKDLADRGNYKCFKKPPEGSDPHPFFLYFKDGTRAEVYTGNSACILPFDLGISLIGVGYEEPEKINIALDATKQFSGGSETPLWRRFVEWRWMSRLDLASAYKEARSYIFNEKDIEPGPYLLIAHCLISIGKHGDGNERDTAKKIVARINYLVRMRKIPAATYGVGYGWSSEGGFSFGGYAFESDELYKLIIDAMRNAQLKEFEACMAGEAKRLFNLLHSDLDAFGREFSWRDGQGGYNRTEILHRIAPHQFASAIFDYVTSGKFEAVGEILKGLADRHHNSQSFALEVAWAKTVKSFMISSAKKAGPVEKARMCLFLRFYWKFPNDLE